MTSPRQALFVQMADPAFYPPLIHAARAMAEAGWKATLLSSPIAGRRLAMPPDPRIEVLRAPERPSHVITPSAYARYAAAAAVLAVRRRPQVVYASDPFGAGPGWLAARLAGAALVYHEHDSPAPGALRPWIARRRQAAATAAKLVVLPNEARAKLFADAFGVADKTLTVWNLPSLAELPAPAEPGGQTLELYYHGSITPERLPETIADALRRLGGRVRLTVAGYEAPGARGYLDRFVARAGAACGQPLTRCLGEIPQRGDLLAGAAAAHVGLAFMPAQSLDVNMRHMVGASNKAFDYLAARLALLVSDLPDWRAAFVEPGYGRAADPGEAGSIAEALTWLIEHPAQRAAMGAQGRARIERDWNYETAFAPVLERLARS